MLEEKTNKQNYSLTDFLTDKKTGYSVFNLPLWPILIVVFLIVANQSLGTAMAKIIDSGFFIVLATLILYYFRRRKLKQSK